MSDPTINEAKRLAKKHDKEIVIIFHVNRLGPMGYASYGQTRGLCEVARRLADVAFNACKRTVISWPRR